MKVLWICDSRGVPSFPLEDVQKILGDCTIIPIQPVEDVNHVHKLVNQHLPEIVVSEVPLSTFIAFFELEWWPEVPLLIPVSTIEKGDDGELRIRLVGFKRIVDVKWIEEEWGDIIEIQEEV